MIAGKYYTRAVALGLALRPEADSDVPFLGALYASTRAAELADVPWPPEAKAQFLDMQFQAQRAHYRRHYPEADWCVVEHAAERIGRLYIERWPSQHRIIDIAFWPEHCGKGFGTALLNDLIDEAAAVGKAVSIHVEKNNPARRLYLRLGFEIAEDKGVYDLMARPAASSGKGGEGPQLKTAS
ncbi:GNAT family N-acetyltransferase [Mesorhizobium hawassense]|uniref:GNAT family N-acetyltransferase n=1 Tax=Mesorhizobium hawassense TaxID=1209954 RepID=A0A330HSD5_9HYPH|nr:GNAT family N-acetyltransferase [Mesorhizobium hawassense]RAZ91305.1 GNAT family N-acetyltransferase [Mesorhizobium hawassense]